MKTLSLPQVSFPVDFPLCYIFPYGFTNSDKGKNRVSDDTIFKVVIFNYITSILISSMILLSFSLFISRHVISITITNKAAIPTTNIPHGIEYSTGNAFRMDKLITNGIAIPNAIPGMNAFIMHMMLSQ